MFCREISSNLVSAKFSSNLLLCLIDEILETLRALYLGDNDFEYLPAEIKNLKNLQIVSWLMLHNDADYSIESTFSLAAATTISWNSHVKSEN